MPRDREKYNVFGRVLDEMLTERGLSQSELGRMIEEEGFDSKAPKNAINNAMLHSKKISVDLLYCIIDALRKHPQGLTREEQGRLEEAARQAAREYRRDNLEDEDQS